MGGYQPHVIEQFPGLDLQREPAESRCLQALNVDFAADLSAIGTRGGLQLLAAGLGAYGRITALPVETLLFRSPGDGTLALDRHLISIANIATWGISFPAWTSDVRFGTPAARLVFIASSAAGGTVNQTLRKLDTVAASVAASVGAPRFVEISPFDDNRLVQARFTTAAGSPTGANGSEHAVFFSDPGAPEVYSPNNFVHLRPGDSEEIQALVTWRDLLFVFKRTAMFVFYGVSTDSTGNPVFLWRGPIPLPSPMPTPNSTNAAFPSLAVATTRGVYVRLDNGVYRTTGDSFDEVSRPIRPTAIVSRLAHQALSADEQRVYLTATGDSMAKPIYVYDETLDAWLEHRTDVSGVRPTNVAPYRVGAAAGGSRVAVNDSLYTFTSAGADDNGTAIESAYQTGFDAHGVLARKTIAELALWGSGSPNVQAAVDYKAVDAGGQVVLGAAPAIIEARQSLSRAGTFFSYKIGAPSGRWQLNRIAAMLRDQRDPGVKAA